MSHDKKPSNDQQQAQADDASRKQQNSHGSDQKRSKKDGHATQLGTGMDQQSGRNHGQGKRR